jgi:biopolymer transport protein ExbB/TolQ
MMEIAAGQPQAGISFVRLIENADPVVQGVMLALAAASVVCWAIGFEKLLRYIGFSAQLREIELAAAKRSQGPRSWLVSRFDDICKEEPHGRDEPPSEFQARLERSLVLESGAQLRRLQSGLPLLATVGSTAPFVGLFGTVWGIMNSFAGIAAAKDTSLPVVAPGIAEALLATAIGLVAAIPAVIFYNLANVFLSNASEKLAAAASRFARGVAYERDARAGESLQQTGFLERQALSNGGIDAR